MQALRGTFVNYSTKKNQQAAQIAARLNGISKYFTVLLIHSCFHNLYSSSTRILKASWLYIGLQTFIFSHQRT